MQASQFAEPDTDDYKECAIAWLEARSQAVRQAEGLVNLGVHKQIANRLLEPFLRKP